jgi:phosphatidylglycerol---prolipoprotein diacylglyceryl transferase
VHPVLIDFGFFQLRSYGLLTAIAFLAGIMLASVLAQKEGEKKDDIYDIGLVAVAGGIIGARLLYVFANWGGFAADPVSIFRVWEGGLVYYGGFLGALAGSVWWVAANRRDFFKLADICMPFLALGHAIGRIGCFLNGCCYGVHSEKCGVDFPGISGGPFLPVQLYESALNFMNFAFLLLYYKNKKRKKGDVFFLYFLVYGIIRFAMEFFRGDPERGTVAGISTSMFISLFMIASGAAGLVYLRVKSGKEKIRKG